MKVRFVLLLILATVGALTGLGPVTLTWNAKSSKETGRGCLYGTSTVPLDSVVAYAGGADQGNKCGPHAPGDPLLPL